MSTDRLSPLALTAAMLTLAVATIAGAWAFELIGGYIPCKLCLQERVPYYAGIIVLAAALAAAYALPQSSLHRLLMALAGLVFLAGLAMGGYHTGVEYGWWAGPSDCGTTGGDGAVTAESLLQQLEGIRIVSCSEASWRFPAGWGPSFAGWNAVVSAVLVVMALTALRRAQPTGADA